MFYINNYMFWISVFFISWGDIKDNKIIITQVSQSYPPGVNCRVESSHARDEVPFTSPKENLIQRFLFLTRPPIGMWMFNFLPFRADRQPTNQQTDKPTNWLTNQPIGGQEGAQRCCTSSNNDWLNT